MKGEPPGTMSGYTQLGFAVDDDKSTFARYEEF